MYVSSDINLQIYQTRQTRQTHANPYSYPQKPIPLARGKGLEGRGRGTAEIPQGYPRQSICAVVMYHLHHTIPVHSRSFSVLFSCSRYSPSPYYYIPFLFPLLFHISILGSGHDELNHQTELLTRSDYILPFYCLCLRIPPCHFR